MLKTGIVLSGGGARAIAHLGIIKALEEEGLNFYKIAGTSAGAVFGVLYAAGMKPDAILDLIIKLKFWSLISPVIPKSGFLSLASLEKLLIEHLPVKTFEELQKKVCINATNLNTGESVCFSSGDLIKPLLASCSIPVLFQPIVFGDNSYIDGGIINNLPADLIKNDVDFVIGLHSNPVDPDFKSSGVKSMIERTLMMAISCNVYARRDLCDIFIEPPELKKYKVLDFNKAKEIFEIGYRYTKENMHTFELEKIKNRHDI